MTQIREADAEHGALHRLPTWALALLAVLLWAAYFVLAYAPSGGVFVYAEF